MAIIRRGGVSDTIELEILTGMVISDRFCFEIEKAIRYEYFKLKHVRVVSKWVIDYFKDHRCAPKKAIKDIYNLEKDKLSTAMEKVIYIFLVRLSRKYATSDDKFNADYILGKAKEYFKKRGTELLFERGEKLVSSGKYGEARELLENYKQIDLETTKRFRLTDDSSIINFGRSSKGNELVSFPDVLGEYIGPFEKGWLVSIAGPEKRGKTWWLMESAIQGMLNREPTVFFSLEMGDHATMVRFYKRLTGYLTDREFARISRYGDYYRYPVFDCKYSRLGKCKLKKGKKFQVETLDDYSPKMKYKTCVECRKGKNRNRWSTSYWFDSIPLKNVKTFNSKRLRSKMTGGFKGIYDNLVVRTFPRFSATFSDIEKELDDLEYTEGFTPKRIVIDYPDIMAPENIRYAFSSERHPINATWMRAGQLATKRQCCVIVGDQTKMQSRTSENIAETDTSEDKRKDAHVDVKIVLNQTKAEYNHGIMRLHTLFHRHEETFKNIQVMVTQMLRFGQPLVDSEYYRVDSRQRSKGGDVAE